MSAESDYRATLRAAILDDDRFVRATFSGTRRGADLPWHKLIIRPVMLKGGRHLQFSFFDARQDITKNYAGDAAGEQLDAALSLPFRHLTVRATDRELEVRFSKKGRALLSERALRSKAASPSPAAFGVPDVPLGDVGAPTVDLGHDRRKTRRALSESAPETAAYLRAVGIMTSDGRIRSEMRAKLKQINHFLALVEDTGALEAFRGASVRAFDAGCGNAYLTFALYHYLTDHLGATTQLVGVDLRDDLLARHAERAAALGWDGLRFQASSIIDYVPEGEGAEAPQIVVALHACDTATDEALAQGIRWGSPLILAAPCCHHHLQAQLSAAPTPELFGPLLRHNILFERFGDLLTDSFRALILRAMGYRADVVQFVSSEHTPRDLLIRAVKTGAPGDPRALAEYAALKAYWGVTPYLETLLGGLTAPVRPSSAG